MAARSLAMVPFAPDRLSTMNCCLKIAVYLGAISRATRSVAPPGGKPMTMRTGLTG
ncbi:hypothetical protein D3C83_98720 [compost metagenome]